ncbi:MAG: methylenetetrahydrofolate reductase [NAD(P)H] [Bacillota bacterium]
MRIKDIFASRRPVLSFEIFPPKGDDRADIVSKLTAELKVFNPAFISVTYGAGGTTRDSSVEISSIVSGFGFEVLSHLTCVGHTVSEIDDILDRLRAAGVENILALRGDPPKGVKNFDYSKGSFRYAVDLIRHIRNKGFFGIGAAAYPEGHMAAPRIDTDWVHLKEKVDAGAEFLITQLFFDNRVFYHFVESVRGLGIFCPISAGILPVLHADTVKRIVSLCGASIPAALSIMLDKYAHDPEGLEKAGIEYAAAQVEDLIENGVDGVHLYTLNRSEWVGKVLRDVGIGLPGGVPETYEMWPTEPGKWLPHVAGEQLNRDAL